MRIAICIDNLKQALIAYSCLYKASSTLITNLLYQIEPDGKFITPVAITNN
jgi:hypothetical protein